jgi:nucleotide-binding universal stress UspA family protein
MVQDMSATPEQNSDTAANNAPRVIVVGLDGSRSSWNAFAWATGSAARSNGQLVAVHVMALTGPADEFGVPFDHSSLVTTRQAIADELKAEAERRAAEVGVSVRFVAEHGEVTQAVSQVARAEHADLVVVGRSAKALHRLAGSVSHRLTCRKDAPIVVVVP